MRNEKKTRGMWTRTRATNHSFSCVLPSSRWQTAGAVRSVPSSMEQGPHFSIWHCTVLMNDAPT